MITITLISYCYTNTILATTINESALSTTVTIEENENGLITFEEVEEETLVKEFNIGEVCKFKIIPNDGYEMESIQAVTEDEEEVSLNYDEETETYFFTVENSQVSLLATYKESQTNEELFETGMNLMLMSARSSGLVYLGKVTYMGHSVGYFNVNGMIAFCLEHSKTSTPTGSDLTQSIYNENENVRNALYYGWGGQEQWSGFNSEEQGIVVTSMALSYYYSGDLNMQPHGTAATACGLSDFFYFLEANSRPDNSISFSPSNPKAELGEDGTYQKTETITFNGDSRNSITINLQDGVALIKTSDSSRHTGSVTISGGTSFYLEAPLTVNDVWETGAMTGAIGKLNAIVAKPSNSSYQTLGYMEIAYDPECQTSLSVEWLKAGTLQLNKSNGYGELVSGAQFRIQSLTDGINYDETITVNDGSATINGLLIGDYTITEIASPTNNGFASGTGYLLDAANSQTITINAGQTTTANYTNYEPTGTITLTKKDSVTGSSAQGLGSLTGAKYQLYAKANIYNAHGTLLYAAGAQVQEVKATDSNAKIVWSNVPMGSYYIKETAASTGYNIDTSAHDVQLSYVDATTSVISRTADSQETVIRGTIQVSKYDSKTGELLKGNTTTFDIYAATKMNIKGTVYNKGDKVETITTVNGIATSSRLPYGTYYVKESGAPNKYTLNETVSGTFTISSEGQVIRYSMSDDPVTGTINMQKIDSETLQPTAQGAATIENATYTLYAGEDITNPATETVLFKKGAEISLKTVGTGEWGDAGTKSTDSNGQITWSNLPIGTYQIKEITPSTGYNLNTTIYTVEVTYEGASVINVVKNQTVTEDVIRANIEFSKFGRDSLDDEKTEMDPLEGVIFSVTSHTTGDTWYMVTNENGYSDTQNNKVYKNIITDQEGNVISVDETSVVETNSRGFFVYDTYTIKEIKTPVGYVAINDITFDLHRQGYKMQWILEDKDIVSALRITKKDAETGETIPLAGTTFRIYDKDMKQLSMVVSRYPTTQYADEFVTDDTGSFTLPEKLKVGTYYIEEVVAPDGYLIGEIQKFTITEGHDWQAPFEIEYLDENVKGNITLHKTDSVTGKDVANATYSIYAAENIITNDGTLRYGKGELVDTITTNEKGYAVTNDLYLGTYRIKETQAPDGYLIDETYYETTLKYKDGVTPYVNVMLDVEDDPDVRGDITLRKTDSITGKSVENATYSIYAAENILTSDGVVHYEAGELVDTITTDEKGYAESSNLYLGAYEVKETKAPDTHLIDDTYYDVSLQYEVKTEYEENESPYAYVTLNVEDDPKTGSIQTRMESKKLDRTGTLEISGMGNKKSPTTGETHRALIIIVLAVASLLAAVMVRKKSIKKGKVVFFLLLMFGVLNFFNTNTYAAEKELVKTEEYTTQDENEPFSGFEDTITEDGRKYTLSQFSSVVVDTIPKRIREEREKKVLTDYMLSTDAYNPDASIQEDEIEYQLQSYSVVEESQYTKSYTTYMEYNSPDADIPNVTTISITNDLGQAMELKANLKNTEVLEEGEWKDNTIQITFDHYDTGIFLWNGHAIYGDSENPLSGYETELLQSVGADTSTYRVISTQWSGEPYTIDGVVYRDAVANVQYYENYVRANYATSVTYVQYESNYIGTEEVESTTDFNYIMEATAVYHKTLSVAQILVLSGIGILILAVFVVLVLHVVAKRKKEETRETLTPVGGEI